MDWSENAVNVILFDLGGVLVRWEGTAGLTELVGGSFSEQDAQRFWLYSPAVQRFEKGLSTPGRFSREVIAELALPIRPDEWLAMFLSWDRGPYPGAVELLRQLHVHQETGCLSNNNELHWCRVRDHHGFGKLFKYQYLSHEIGLFKPDPGIFEHVLRDLQLPPDTILYLDDSPDNIESASSLGFRAIQTRGIREVSQVLYREGLLDRCDSAFLSEVGVKGRVGSKKVSERNH